MTTYPTEEEIMQMYRELYPQYSDKELVEVRQRMIGYIRIVMRIVEKQKTAKDGSTELQIDGNDNSIYDPN